MAQTCIIESYQEFAARHGNKPVHVGNWIVFEDGAYVAAENGDIRFEPDADTHKRLRAQRDYHTTALKNAEFDFNKVQKDFADQALLAAQYSNLPGPPENAVEILEAIKAVAAIHRAALAEVREALIDPATARSLAERDRQDAERRNAVMTLGQQITSVRL